MNPFTFGNLAGSAKMGLQQALAGFSGPSALKLTKFPSAAWSGIFPLENQVYNLGMLLDRALSILGCDQV